MDTDKITKTAPAIILRLPFEMKTRLKNMAHDNRMSLSAFLRQSLSELLIKNKAWLFMILMISLISGKGSNKQWEIWKPLGYRTISGERISKVLALYTSFKLWAFKMIHKFPSVLLMLLCWTQAAMADNHIDLNRIMFIESSGNADAYNRHSGARGLYQITPICLADYNQVNNTHYKPVQMHDPQLGSMVAYWYINERIPALFEHYGIPDSIEHRLIAYNAGIRAVLRGVTPRESKDYIRKYNKAITA